MKLTLEHLKVYKKYHGDVDIWARTGKKSEAIMNHVLWSEVDALLGRLELMKNELTSESFNAETRERLLKLCDSQDTEKFLLSLVGEV